MSTQKKEELVIKQGVTVTKARVKQIFLSATPVANWAYTNLNSIHKIHHRCFSTTILVPGSNHSAALIAPLAASRFISAALPLPLKYMYTCCKYINNRNIKNVRKGIND